MRRSWWVAWAVLLAAAWPLEILADAAVGDTARSAPDSSGWAPAAPDSSPSAPADPATPLSRSPTQRIGHTAQSFVSDFGYVLSSPFRLKGRGLLWATGVVAATAVIYGYDNEIMDAFHRSRGDPIYDAMVDLGERFESLGFMAETAPYWAGGAVLGTALGRYRPFREIQSISLDVLESHVITGTIRNTAKTLIGRPRPLEADRSTFFENGNSTPSGHASVVFEVATILTRHTRGAPLAVRIPVGVIGYGIATAVAVQRIDSESHWPSDVFLGAVSGAVIANTVARRNEERRANDARAEVSGSRGPGAALLRGGGISIEPWLDPSGAKGIQVFRCF